MLPAVLTSMITFGAALLALAFFRAHDVVIGLLAVCGCSMVVCTALCNTSIQRRIPDAMRGRVLSMYTFAFSAFLPFGNLTAGILAEKRGLGPTMSVLGGGLLVSAAAAVGAVGWARSRKAA